MSINNSSSAAFATHMLPSLYVLIEPKIEVEMPPKSHPQNWGWNRVGEVAAMLGVPADSVWNAYAYNAHRFELGQGRGQGYNCNQRFMFASTTGGATSVVRYAIDQASGCSVKFDGPPDDLMLPSGWVQGWLGKEVTMVLCLGDKPVPAVLLTRPLDPPPLTMREIAKHHIHDALMEQALLEAPVEVMDPLDDAMLSLVSKLSAHMQFKLFARPWTRTARKGGWNLIVQAFPATAPNGSDDDTYHDGWRFVLNQRLLS